MEIYKINTELGEFIVKKNDKNKLIVELDYRRIAVCDYLHQAKNEIVDYIHSSIDDLIGGIKDISIESGVNKYDKELQQENLQKQMQKADLITVNKEGEFEEAIEYFQNEIHNAIIEPLIPKLQWREVEPYQQWVAQINDDLFWSVWYMIYDNKTKYYYQISLCAEEECYARLEGIITFNYTSRTKEDAFNFCEEYKFYE